MSLLPLSIILMIVCKTRDVQLASEGVSQHRNADESLQVFSCGHFQPVVTRQIDSIVTTTPPFKQMNETLKKPVNCTHCADIQIEV